jgi:hypothetical protein
MRRAKRILTPANVLAGLALFFALGGTGWAGQVIGKSSVGSAQLKSSAVTSSKIANGAVTATKFATGVIGGVNPGKITKIDSPIAAVQPNSTGTVVSAQCPAGSKAVGGGWSAGLYGYQLSEGPTPDGLGWTATFATYESPATVTVSVICIAA